MAISVMLMLLAWQPEPAALRRIFEEALARRAAEFGERDARTAQAARDLGQFLMREGDQAGAAVVLQRAVTIDESVLGPEADETLRDVVELATVSDAETLWQRASRAKNPAVASQALAALGAAREAVGDARGSVDLYRRALAMEEKAGGVGGVRVAVRLNSLALAVGPPEAVGLLRRAVTINRAALGAQHPETASTMTNLSGMLLASERIAEAVQVGTQAVVAFEAVLGEHPRTASALSNLADALRAQGVPVRAEALYRRALAIDREAYGPTHPDTIADVKNLVDYLRELKRGAEAVRVEREYGIGR